MQHEKRGEEEKRREKEQRMQGEDRIISIEWFQVFLVSSRVTVTM